MLAFSDPQYFSRTFPVYQLSHSDPVSYTHLDVYKRQEWNTEDIWVRRSFNLNQDLTNDIIYLRYSHDDVFELYLNGEKLVATDYSWNDDVTIELSASAKARLRKGTNIIAAHCHNTTGGAYVDFGPVSYTHLVYSSSINGIMK